MTKYYVEDFLDRGKIGRTQWQCFYHFLRLSHRYHAVSVLDYAGLPHDYERYRQEEKVRKERWHLAIARRDFRRNFLKSYQWLGWCRARRVRELKDRYSL